PLRASPVPTTLTLNVSPTTGTLSGKPVTMTATLSPYNVSGPPSTTTDGQTITFYSNGAQVGVVPLSSGVAVLTSTTLPAGTDALNASYAGTLDYGASSTSTISVTVSNVLLASSPNPSSFHQAVTLSATVPAGATGTVIFKDGTTSLGQVTLSTSTAFLT